MVYKITREEIIKQVNDYLDVLSDKELSEIESFQYSSEHVKKSDSKVVWLYFKFTKRRE